MRFEEVAFRYRRGPWVLRDVTAGFGAGDVVVVQGRNGAGKSTLLQLAAGVLRPGRGRITGRPTRIGWVPERFPTDQPFTVASYLTAMGRALGAPPGVGDWAERLGLAPLLGVRLGELSKGSAQKVGLAQALLVPPDLLVLDEPWEGLDAQTREVVPEIVAGVVSRGGSVLISDHRGEVARLPGATVWTVADGGVAETAPADQRPWVIEVRVAAALAPGVVADLRAAGHEVTRFEQVRADAAEEWSGS